MEKVSKFALMTLLLATGCSGPTRDQSQLQAIQAEAQTLTRSTTTFPVTLQKGQWPQAIASLKPENVTVSADGVDVLIKPYFDGGSGYFIPSNGGQLPEPKRRFEPVGEGVFWYHPY